eukprot:gnl/Spiro4/22616_TR11157_c0_g4_i1.p1 gnl/Spiro4/22616_TR11157_c0_g4~~gnl/Spiro4/22616_TR11157_c0_g4_i1.p1  ORF type:complete len:482 (+),score=106.65 gnl/Spiro4/22616_TR11157_c0_g4_i1:103-1446(+)
MAQPLPARRTRPALPVLPRFQASVGHSVLPGSHDAGVAAAREAIAGLNGEPCGWAIVFLGGQHQRAQAIAGMREVVGPDVLLFGGSTPGVICNELASCTAWELFFAAFPAFVPKPEVALVTGIKEKGEVAVGRELGAKLKEKCYDGDTVFMFYNSIQDDVSNPPPSVNTGSFLLKGVYEGLGPTQITLCGAGMMSDAQLMRKSYVILNDAVDDAVAALIVPSQLEVNTLTMHGCKPLSDFIEVTRVEGATLYELDGQPALQVILKQSGQDTLARETVNINLSVSLGQKEGEDPYGEFDESDYSNRLILAADWDKGSVQLFEAEYQNGQHVQIMHRDNELMLQSTKERVPKILKEVSTKAPVLAFYIDCCGRSKIFSGSAVEEGDVTRQIVRGAGIPICGIYAALEIGPKNNTTKQSVPLNWTGVMTVLSVKGLGASSAPAPAPTPAH